MPVWTPKPAAPRVVQWAGAPASWFDLSGPRRTFASDTGDVADLTGRTRAGVRSTGCVWGTGPGGGGLSFGGSTRGNVRFANPALPASADWSVGIRFALGAYGSGATGLIARGDWQSPGQFNVYVNSDRLLAVDIPFVASNVAAGSTPVTLGTPHEAVLVKQGSTFRIYLDGRLDGQATVGPTPVNAGALWLGDYGDQGFLIGTWRADGAYYHGRPIDAAEVFRNFNDPTWRLRAPVATFLLAPPAASTNPATGSISLGRAAVSGTGTSTNQGSGAVAVGKAAVAGTGSATNPATGTIGLGRLAVSATAAGTNPAAGSISLRRVAISGAATASNSGAGLITLARVQVGNTPPVPTDPLLFEVELETWLRATLGRPAWPGMIPQGQTGTCLVYTLVSTNSELNLDGPDGLREWHLQFDAWGKTRLEAITLIERLRLALEGYTGPMGRAEVLDATLEPEGDDFAPPVNASDRPAHRRRAEYTIFFRDGLSS